MRKIENHWFYNEKQRIYMNMWGKYWKSLVLQYKTKDLYENVRESIENHAFCNIKQRIYVKLSDQVLQIIGFTILK